MTTNRTYGFMDEKLVRDPNNLHIFSKSAGITLALLFILLVWLGLNQKLLFGEAWISETYDHKDWRTNEGNLPTHGAWDLETHIWKTQFIMDNFPNHDWNPYWYLGMPIIEYYQPGFYFLHWAFTALTNLETPRSALLLIILSHLLAAYMTFFLCYMVSRRIVVSALCSVFIIANTFITLRSYGWEPITVVFLFLYPLGLLFFLKDPLNPFRFSIILVLTIAYLSHPLIFFSLCMSMGLYLISIAVRKNSGVNHIRYMWKYFAAIFASLMLGALQFIPHMEYDQATSGAHMGVTYLPYYQVPYNIITLRDFFFDAGNLKGPGPIIMIAALLILAFGIVDYTKRKERRSYFIGHEIVAGVTLILFTMVLFYYLELYNIFPMNFLRSIQYHRIIPEFVITAAVLVAAISTIITSFRLKTLYYSLLISFAIASGIIIYNVQDQWRTVDDISAKPEFIFENVPGRISFPYSDQSLAVRSSFTKIPQVYGYYEQGITNPYADELFSVSSGFHNPNLAILYMKAANVGRLYVNTEEGYRDSVMAAKMNSTMNLKVTDNPRYAYFEIPLEDSSFAEAVEIGDVKKVKDLEVGCRVIFKENYCGSKREEFVSLDIDEIMYLAAYVTLLEEPQKAKAEIIMRDPDHYIIHIRNANKYTAVVVKMTYSKNFEANLNGKKLNIEPIGPYFMLIYPSKEGSYSIGLEYKTSTSRLIGIIISIATLIILILFFSLRHSVASKFKIDFPRGDMS